MVRGRGGPEDPPDHPLGAGGGEAERVQGGGDHAVVLRLHHWSQPGDGGKYHFLSVKMIYPHYVSGKECFQ